MTSRLNCERSLPGIQHHARQLVNSSNTSLLVASAQISTQATEKDTREDRHGGPDEDVVDITLPRQKNIFLLNLKHQWKSIDDADIGSLKSLHTLFDKYLDHMLVKFDKIVWP